MQSLTRGEVKAVQSARRRVSKGAPLAGAREELMVNTRLWACENKAREVGQVRVRVIVIE